MNSLKQGVLVAIEGIDGSGKSTLAKNLYAALSTQFPTLLTREPGATPLGAKLRTIVQEKSVPLTAQAEYLLFAADRAQHFDEFVLPMLDQKNLIISDRMADSSLVYQGYGRGLTKDIIAAVNGWVMHKRNPDLVIFVRIDAQTAQQRLVQRGKALTSFECEQQEFTATLIKGFDEIYAQKNNVIALDGTLSPETLTFQAIQQVTSWIQNNNIHQ